MPWPGSALVERGSSPSSSSRSFCTRLRTEMRYSSSFLRARRYTSGGLACAAARKAGWQVYGVTDPIFAHNGSEMGKVCHVYPFDFEKEL